MQIEKKFKSYQIAIFFVTMFTSLFLALNLVPVLTKTGDTSASVLQLDVEINPVIALNLSKDELSLDVTPTIDGSFVYDTTIATVSTNNKAGYTLTMNTSMNNIDLTQENTSHKIKSLANPATVSADNQSSFTTNSWGYAKANGLSGNTVFNPIPSVTSPVTLIVTDSPTKASSTPITYATKLDTSITSGLYKNTVIFSAVTNHVTTATFSGILFMQEMTAAICSAETTPAKNTTQTTTIHTTNSNFIPEAVLTDARDGETYVVRKLADGNCWMTDDLRIAGNKTLTPADSNVVADFNLPPVATEGFLSTSTPVVASPHGYYGVGAYYSWAAATAATGMDTLEVDGAEAPSSICPKGWHIPSNSGDKSYDNLINSYGFTEGSQIARYPFMFWYGGSYGDNNLIIDGIGYYWTSTAKSAEYAHYLAFNPDNIATQDYVNRYLGFTVRCIASGPQYTINFNSDNADSGIASASAELGKNFNLSYHSSQFTKTGFELKQWRDQDGNIYDANSASININPDNKSKIILTAIWEQMSPTFSGITTMQAMTAEICAAETTPRREATMSTIYHSENTNLIPEATLTDTRDNNTYIVRKLADGNCWMTQDLRIVGRKTLNSSNSDVTSNFTLPVASSSGFTAYDAAQVAPINTEVGNGAFYSWTAATAGTGTTSITTDGEEATSSICPKGWRLPPNRGKKSYDNLVIAARATPAQITSPPFSFNSPGYYLSSALNNSGESGYYWTSTAASFDKAYSFFTSSSYVESRVANPKLLGFSVRCVAK